MSTTYIITCYFGWREPTTLSIESMIMYSLICIFLGPLVETILNLFNKYL